MQAQAGQQLCDVVGGVGFQPSRRADRRASPVGVLPQICCAACATVAAVSQFASSPAGDPPSVGAGAVAAEPDMSSSTKRMVFAMRPICDDSAGKSR